MKNFLLSAACAAAVCGGVASAQDSPWTVTGSVALTSNYVFRGLTQTREDPAIQGGATISHSSGFYVGLWGSNVDFGDGESDIETDFFAGYGFSLGENTTADINVTYYAYPGSPADWNYDFVEFIGGITHDFGGAKIGVKAAYSPDTFGGFGDAFWLAGNVSVPLGDFVTISGNVGEQWYDDAGLTDYLHYDLGVTFAYEGVSLDLRYIGTDLDTIDEYFVATLGFGF